MTGPAQDAAHPAAADQQHFSALLTDAAEVARTAVVQFSGAETVGEHLGVHYEDPTAATHQFLANLDGYQGWQWEVVVAAYPGADHATVSEVVLVPGSTALLAPEWVPWEQRIEPGDLSPGDQLAPTADDPRLVPGHAASGDPQVDDAAAELGLGRRWVMSRQGRIDAAQRWHDGDHGPGAAMARSTKRVCRDCGFFLPLAGSLGTMFGACGNKMSADGHIVDSMYGCGAHSDTPAPPGGGTAQYEPYDDGVLDVEAPAPEDPEAPEAPEAPEDPEAPGDREASEAPGDREAPEDPEAPGD